METKVECANFEHCGNEAARKGRYCSGCVMRKHRYGDHSAPIRKSCRPRRPDSIWVGTNGYLYCPIYPEHPLYNGAYIIQQHRLILFDKIGFGPHQCHWCHEHINWGNGLEVDHLDWNKHNNLLDNIVPSCKVCNNKRKKLAIEQ